MVVAALLALLVAAGCTPTTPPTTWLAAGCYNSPVADAPDVRFSGTPNAAGNLTVSLDISSFTLSTDGTCAGVPLGSPYTLTLVRAADETAALAACTAAGQNDGAGQAQSEYPSFPADAWICNPPATT
jgi:hypothetical protein